MLGGQPPQPDFRGAAQEQSAASRQLTTEQTYANRPNISTPWGGVRWTPPAYDPYYQGGGGGGGAPGGGGGGYGGGGGSPDIAGAIGNYDPFGGGGRGRPVFGSIRDMLAKRDAYGQDGGSGRPPDPWGMEVYLSPEQQAAMEAQQRIGRGRSDIAESLLGRARGELGAAPDYSSLPEFGGGVSPEDLPQYDASGAPGLPDVGDVRNRAEEALYQRSSQRLNPEWEQRQQQLDSQLRSQGILPGSPAYTQQMQQFERGREAAYAGARQEAISGGGEEAQRQFGMGLSARQQAVGEAGQRFGAGMARAGQGFGQRMQASQYATQRRNAQLGEMLQKRGYTLNEINALLSGQQVGMPQLPNFALAGQAQPPNYTGAAGQQYEAGLNAYNARQAQMQAMLSGLGGLGYLPFGF